MAEVRYELLVEVQSVDNCGVVHQPRSKIVVSAKISLVVVMCDLFDVVAGVDS